MKFKRSTVTTWLLITLIGVVLVGAVIALGPKLDNRPMTTTIETPEPG